MDDFPKALFEIASGDPNQFFLVKTLIDEQYRLHANSMKSKHSAVLLPLALVFLGGTIAAISAPTISTTIFDQGTDSGTFNLETYGTTDWVHFGVSGTSTAFDLTNEMSGGSVGGLDTVGAVSESNDPTAGRTQNTSNIAVTYANGTSPGSSASLVDGVDAGTWNIQTGYDGDAVTNAALTFTIDFNKAISSGTIYVAGNNYSAPADFTASLSNGNSTDTPVLIGYPNRYDIFAVDVSDITAGSSLTLSWIMPTGNGLDNVSLSGVALDLTEAPEPSTWLMMAFGGIGLLLARRVWKKPAGLI
jgi:hypothetical protein